MLIQNIANNNVDGIMRTHSLLLYLYQASLLHQQTRAQVLQVAEHTEPMCHSLL